MAEAARYAVVLQGSMPLLTRKDDPQPILKVVFNPAEPDAAMPALHLLKRILVASPRLRQFTIITIP